MKNEIDGVTQTIARSPITGREDHYYYTDELVVIEVRDRPVVAVALATDETNHVWVSFDGSEWSDISSAGLCKAGREKISHEDIDYLTHLSSDALALWDAVANPRNTKGEKFEALWRNSITPPMTFDQALRQRLKDRDHAANWISAVAAAGDDEGSDAVVAGLILERMAFLIECYGPWYGR